MDLKKIWDRSAATLRQKTMGEGRIMMCSLAALLSRVVICFPDGHASFGGLKVYGRKRSGIAAL